MKFWIQRKTGYMREYRLRSAVRDWWRWGRPMFVQFGELRPIKVLPLKKRSKENQRWLDEYEVKKKARRAAEKEQKALERARIAAEKETKRDEAR